MKCSRCSREAVYNQTKCVVCRDGQRRLDNNRLKVLTEKGLCLRCRKVPMVDGHTKCQKCLDTNRDYARKKRASGGCYDCHRPLDEFALMTGRKRCADCLDNKNRYNRRVRLVI